MKFYNQSELFNVLLSAAASAGGSGFLPEPALLSRYRNRRLIRATQALKTRNLWLYTEGSRPGIQLTTGTTIYTQPAGCRLMLVGYADNFRYGKIHASTAGGPTDLVWPQEHRISIIGKNARSLVQDLIPAQAAVSGQPRYTAAILTVPEIIEADEQIAVDIAYDSAAVAPTVIEPQAFMFFCLRVSDKLTQLDLEAIADITAYIRENDYQRGQFLNCVSLGTNFVSFSSAAAGGTASCDTRTITAPLLITGIATSLVASKLKITDAGDGYSFSLDKFMQSSCINMPDYENQGATNLGAPVWAPNSTLYYQFPMPHLLRRGSQLHVDVVNGGNAGAGAGTVVDPQTGQVIIFSGLTV